MFDWIGDLWSNSWLDQAFDWAGNQFGSGTTGIGPVVDGGRYASMLGEGSSDGGFFSDLFSSKNLAPSLIGLGSQLYKESQAPSFEEQLDQKRQLGELEMQQQKDMLKYELELKKSLGLLGGGGSSGPNYGEQNKQLRYKGMLDALGGAAEGSIYGANTLNNAYANLMGALRR